jgi:hypothetical protein
MGQAANVEDVTTRQPKQRAMQRRGWWKVSQTTTKNRSVYISMMGMRLACGNEATGPTEGATVKQEEKGDPQ